MKRFPIGVIINSFRTDIPTSVKKAAEVGAQGIQVYATSGEMAPENLSKEKRREFLDLVKSNGLIISALCGDLGGGGFTHPEKNPAKIEKILDACVEKPIQSDFCHRIVWFGREICSARAPQCVECPMREFCRHAQKESRKTAKK